MRRRDPVKRTAWVGAVLAALVLVWSSSLQMKSMLAKGEVEIGVTFLSEMDDPGIDVLGPLPGEVSTATSFVGLISAHAKNPAGAKALLDYISSRDAVAVYKAKRMQPSR